MEKRDFRKEPFTQEEAKQVVTTFQSIYNVLKDLWERASNSIRELVRSMSKEDEDSFFAAHMYPRKWELIRYRHKLKNVQKALRITKHTVSRKKLLKEEAYYKRQIQVLEEQYKEVPEEVEKEE